MSISEFLFGSNNTVNPNFAHQVTLMHLDLRLPLMRLHSLYQGRSSSQYHLLPKHQRKHMKLLKDHVRYELAIFTHFSCCVKLSLSRVCVINATPEMAELMWV